MVLPASSIFRPRMCLEWCSSRARQCLQPAFLGYFQCRTGNDSVGFNAIDLWIDIAVLTLLARHLVILVSPIMSVDARGLVVGMSAQLSFLYSLLVRDSRLAHWRISCFFGELERGATRQSSQGVARLLWCRGGTCLPQGSVYFDGFFSFVCA